MIPLDLPDVAVADRVSLTRFLPAGERAVYADLDGPGCIRHIWTTPTRLEMVNRKTIIRIYFDDEPVPYVEAPVGDLFGVMHGKAWYPLNTDLLSVKAESGYSCYFAMPFAKSARIEFEAGDEGTQIYLQVGWHRYPDQEMRERRRFCARWRREMPTQRYGEAYQMLDADGPGDLVGFVYGVRLIDNVDRWSHGGAENIYIDGDGKHPAYLRGIGGEDTFGTSYGGAKHPPETHLHAAMPYYVHDDVGEARPAQRLVGYRFFTHGSVSFQSSIHMRFGCMCNDICSTVYWYQQKPVRPFFKLPESSRLLPGAELRRGECDMALPPAGEWWVCGPFGNADNRSMKATLPAESDFEPEATYDGSHEEGSGWLTDGSKELGRDVARWQRRPAIHGFIDFNHVFAPYRRGVGATHPGVAVARCTLNVDSDTTAALRFSWDDHLIVRINGKQHDLGINAAFRSRMLDAQLKSGANEIVVKLSNTIGSNHGGWAFAFSAITADGTILLPDAI